MNGTDVIERHFNFLRFKLNIIDDEEDADEFDDVSVNGIDDDDDEDVDDDDEISLISPGS